MESWLIGVVLASLAAFVAALGDNAIRKAFKNRDEKVRTAAQDHWLEYEDLVWEFPVFHEPLFLLGNFALTILNSSLTVAALAFADASQTIPFGVLHIVLNVPIAYFVNHEQTTMNALILNFFICLGVILVLLGSNKETELLTPEQLMSSLISAPFIGVTILFCALGIYARILAHGHIENSRHLGLTFGAGLLGALTQLFARSMALCLKQNAWKTPVTYMFTIWTSVSAGSQLYLLNLCLDKYPASFVVPIVNAVVIVLGSSISAVFFHEVDKWDDSSTIMVPLGIITTGVAVVALSGESETSRTRQEPAMSEMSNLSENAEDNFEKRLLRREIVVDNEQPDLLADAGMLLEV